MRRLRQLIASPGIPMKFASTALPRSMSQWGSMVVENSLWEGAYYLRG